MAARRQSTYLLKLLMKIGIPIRCLSGKAGVNRHEGFLLWRRHGDTAAHTIATRPMAYTTKAASSPRYSTTNTGIATIGTWSG
ncbi:MAG TPA: hypothetical protein VGO47_12940 [Chlamydiales bacterium]|nr:hypothetical protein [Chlamydiales bacterium]